MRTAFRERGTRAAGEQRVCMQLMALLLLQVRRGLRFASICRPRPCCRSSHRVQRVSRIFDALYSCPRVELKAEMFCAHKCFHAPELPSGAH